jgi:hypothetical protein
MRDETVKIDGGGQELGRIECLATPIAGLLLLTWQQQSLIIAIREGGACCPLPGARIFISWQTDAFQVVAVRCHIAQQLIAFEAADGTLTTSGVEDSLSMNIVTDPPPGFLTVWSLNSFELTDGGNQLFHLNRTPISFRTAKLGDLVQTANDDTRIMQSLLTPITSYVPLEVAIRSQKLVLF